MQVNYAVTAGNVSTSGESERDDGDDDSDDGTSSAGDEPADDDDAPEPAAKTSYPRETSSPIKAGSPAAVVLRNQQRIPKASLLVSMEDQLTNKRLQTMMQMQGGGSLGLTIAGLHPKGVVGWTPLAVTMMVTILLQRLRKAVQPLHQLLLPRLKQMVLPQMLLQRLPCIRVVAQAQQLILQQRMQRRLRSLQQVHLMLPMTVRPSAMLSMKLLLTQPKVSQAQMQARKAVVLQLRQTAVRLQKLVAPSQ